MSDSISPKPRRNLKFLPTRATFKLLEPLGTGTVGTVYRAESPDITEPVAVKLLHPTLTDDENIAGRFQREIVIMERLNHPHIVRNYGGGMMDGQYFYAMQLIDHGTLKDRIKKHGPLTWQQGAAYAAQIASALQHAHNHGIIHRDLKTSNLFFDKDDKLLLGDFGIARDTHESDITDQGVAMGTYAYMSPEQICGDKAITGKADLYSLGCVMVEMLTGKPPFTGTNFAQVWSQHLNDKPKGLRASGIECPEWLEKIIMQLLEKDPEKRPFNARAVQGYLKDHLADEIGPDWPQFTRVTQNPPKVFTAQTTSQGSDVGGILLALLLIGVLTAAAVFFNS
jgi:eukaryotic-like serine/threonine-protein kinase